MRDYYGDFEAVTSMVCGSWTTDTHTYYGRWVSCAAGRGEYRTYAEGVVDPDSGLPVERFGASTDITLC